MPLWPTRPQSPGRITYGCDVTQPGALWEDHLAAFEVIDPEAARMRASGEPAFEALRTASPRLALSLGALTDLHPWVGWLRTTNRAFPTDVVPRLFVRELGMFAHTHSHSPPWAWERRLREAGVDPLGEPEVQAPRALAVLLEGVARARAVGYGG